METEQGGAVIPDPLIVGQRVLANLARGRDRQLERRRQRAEELRELVLRAARLDRAADKPDSGRAGRIARRLQLTGVSIGVRRVQQILRTDGPTFRNCTDET